MNLLDFTTEYKWPFNADTFKFMQGQLLLLQQMSLLGGTSYIVSGCVVTGGNVSNGKVVVNGEVLDFVGGAAQPYIIVVDTPINRLYGDVQIRPYKHERYATFGTGTLQYAWAGFERNDPAAGVLKRMREAEDLLNATATGLATLQGVYNTHTHTWASITGKPNAVFSYASTYTLGDIGVPGNEDSIYTITIPNQGDSNYIVVGSLFGQSVTWQNDNDVSWCITDKTATQFKIACRDLESLAQNLKFDFAIIKLS